VAAGVATLCNDRVDAEVDGVAGIPKCLNLADHRNTDLAALAEKRRRVGERQEQCPGTARQDLIQKSGLIVQHEGDEAKAHRRIARDIELILDPIRIAIPPANQAKPTSTRHGGTLVPLVVEGFPPRRSEISAIRRRDQAPGPVATTLWSRLENGA